MKEGVAEDAARLLRELTESLPADHKPVVLIFDSEGYALLLAREPYGPTLERLRDWVDAQDGGPVSEQFVQSN